MHGVQKRERIDHHVRAKDQLRLQVFTMHHILYHDANLDFAGRTPEADKDCCGV